VKAIRAMVTFGVQPQNFAESLSGIISQRLVRKLCQHCRQRIDLPENDVFLDDVRPLLPHDWTPVLYEPGRCGECHNVGFTKPICVPEILPFDTELRRMVADCRPLVELDRAAHGSGMVTFRQAAMTRVALGQTTLQEVMRVVPFDDLRELEREEWEEPLRSAIQSVSHSDGNGQPAAAGAQ
jgi:type II secretory ATPase GspE/PulE/Tfp pilus assembly ATPase PilB-like protein